MIKNEILIFFFLFQNLNEDVSSLFNKGMMSRRLDYYQDRCIANQLR